MTMEINPDMMDEASDPEVNTLQLWLIVQKLFSTITRNYPKVPDEIRKVLNYVREEVVGVVGGGGGRICAVLSLVVFDIAGVACCDPAAKKQPLGIRPQEAREAGSLAPHL